LTTRAQRAIIMTLRERAQSAKQECATIGSISYAGGGRGGWAHNPILSASIPR